MPHAWEKHAILRLVPCSKKPDELVSKTLSCFISVGFGNGPGGGLGRRAHRREISWNSPVLRVFRRRQDVTSSLAVGEKGQASVTFFPRTTRVTRSRVMGGGVRQSPVKVAVPAGRSPA